MIYFPAGYLESAADKAARRGYETRDGAEAARKLQPHPWHWYVWQMNDGRWHISLTPSKRMILPNEQH